MFRGVLLGAVALLSIESAWAQDDNFYDELNAFAMAQLDAIQAQSFAADTEFCGYIGLDANEQLVATPPRQGQRDGCQPPEPPADWEVLASYHTHGAFTLDADTEVPSPDDLIGDIDEGVDGYIGTPGGRVWLDIYDEEVAVQLCGPGCIRADDDFVECPAFMPQEEYTVDGLEQRAVNDPGTC